MKDVQNKKDNEYPLVTIAFPVYERTTNIEKALLSAINQTIKCNVLVVDNCSSHNFFKELCDKYSIRYYRNDSNIGMFPNWNRCMSLIDTQYGMLFHDDNLLEPTYVEKFIYALNAYPDIDIFFSNFQCRNLSTGQNYNHRHVLPFGYHPNGNKVIEYGIRYKLGFPCSFIIKMDCFKEYYTESHGSNDWLALYSNALHLRFFGDSQILFYFGTHPGQDSKNLNTQMKCFLSMAYIYSDVLQNQTNENNLKLLSAKRSKEAFYYFMSIVSKEYHLELLKENSIYAMFYKKILRTNPSLSAIIQTPRFLRQISYKILRRVRLFEAPQ